MKYVISKPVILITLALVSMACTEQELRNFFGDNVVQDSPSVHRHSAIEVELVNEINDERAGLNDDDCSGLKMIGSLHDAALTHAESLGSGVDPATTLDEEEKRITDSGYGNPDQFEEVRVAGEDDADDVLNKLLRDSNVNLGTDSERTRGIILDCDFEDIGVGFDSENDYWVLILAKK